MSYIAWHFCNKERRMAYGDDRPLEKGKTYRTIWPYNGHTKPTLCKAGMHGSLKILDALSYAPGPIVSLTEIHGRVALGNNKIVGDSRRIIAIDDISEELKLFSRLCALDVVHLWDAPKIVVEYLNTGDDSIREAARDAAWAAWAAWAAARGAAWAAAREAIRDAAWAAAWAAARGAAWAAARGADREAAREKQNKRLEELVHKKLGIS